jgi:hypothetical protein
MIYHPGKRVTREELYEAVWTKTVGTLIKEWRTNYLQVNEACRRLQVPRPKPAYWQHIMRGRLIRRKPLKKATRRLPREWVLLTFESALYLAVAAVREKFDEEGSKRRREEQRQQQEIREREEERRKAEDLNRRRLEESARAWEDARRLRRFIRACEGSIGAQGEWQVRWLNWANEHTNRLDPLTGGYLAAERQRLTSEG